jgi:hypothetical protein
MRVVLNQQSRELRSFHRYDPAQFGFRAENETELFGDYCERFNLCTVLHHNPAIDADDLSRDVACFS